MFLGIGALANHDPGTPLIVKIIFILPARTVNFIFPTGDFREPQPSISDVSGFGYIVDVLFWNMVLNMIIFIIIKSKNKNVTTPRY